MVLGGETMVLGWSTKLLVEEWQWEPVSFPLGPEAVELLEFSRDFCDFGKVRIVFSIPLAFGFEDGKLLVLFSGNSNKTLPLDLATVRGG